MGAYRILYRIIYRLGRGFLFFCQRQGIVFGSWLLTVAQAPEVNWQKPARLNWRLPPRTAKTKSALGRHFQKRSSPAIASDRTKSKFYKNPPEASLAFAIFPCYTASEITIQEVSIMAILLTGGAGFIGSHTAVACLNAGVEVVLADNFSNSSPKVLDRIEKISGKRPALITSTSATSRRCAAFSLSSPSQALFTLQASRPSVNPSVCRWPTTATISTPR